MPDAALGERARIVALLSGEARVAGTVGDVYRQKALTEAISLIQHP